MLEAFDTPGSEAPAVIPAAFEQAALAARPQLTAGAQPAAAVVLVAFDARGVVAS